MNLQPNESENSEPEPQSLRLDQFLKMNFVTETGGQAKLLIQSGEVLVNEEVETRRRRKLIAGDVVQANGETMVVPAPGEEGWLQ